MSETDPAKSGVTSEKKWDFSNPQIMLGVLAIAVSIAGSVFGVALAVPWGQDILCNSVNLGCPHFEVADLRAKVDTIDFKGWCDEEYKNVPADEPPPPGLDRARDACKLDFFDHNPAGFFSDVTDGGFYRSSDKVLALHFEMSSPPQQINTPFTLRTECSRHDDSIRMWQRLPCQLSPPEYGPVEAGLTLAPQTFEADAVEVSPDGSELRATILKKKGGFVGRWRLDIERSKNGNLEAGTYRVEIIVGGAGEPIDKTPRTEVLFTVLNPGDPAPAGTN